jgi:PiT family inorganic phosphate transporter
MTDAAVTAHPLTFDGGAVSSKPKLDAGMGAKAMMAFFAILAIALFFVAYSVWSDIRTTGTHPTTWLPYLLLGVALFIALGFEFVNGFHDTANAVATVIYTHSLPASVAVLWSGVFNFLGVLVSSGVVAYGIIALLPVELILQVGSGAGFAMVFALLIGAIIWNAGTWYLGLPASSSHTLIGSIIGVGLANQLMVSGSAAGGVDWAQATKVGYSLLLSPLIGFGLSALLLTVLKTVVRNPVLYTEPKGTAPPPWWIRGLLIFTCTGVSFAHGSNDGQKGMGLIMLILIGVVPTAYALNRAVPDSQIQSFLQTSAYAAQVLEHGHDTVHVDDPRAVISAYLHTRKVTPELSPALAALSRSVAGDVENYGSFRRVPAAAVQNVRNDMYLIAESIRRVTKEKHKGGFAKADVDVLNVYRAELDEATRFIPIWVKVAVAIALGLGTMVGWKRIVVTVGEKIGKSHLTYAQGASAELVAATTIAAADLYGLPVSTTHVLSSGVAGAMAANRSGLQLSTVRNMAMAWVLTLPVAIVLSATLFFLFSHIF